MKIEIRYLSKLGHTKDIANAIGEQLNIEAKSITDYPILEEEVDILFLGGAPYANIMDNKLREFAKNLSKDKVKEIVLFTTSNWSRRTVYALKKIFKQKEIDVYEDYFYAHMLNIKNRIPEAKKFASRVVNEIKGEK